MKLVYTPNTASGLPPIEIPAQGLPYEIVRGSLYGFGGVKAQHFASQSPTQNGATYFASRYDARPIMFSFRISAGSFDALQTLKREVSRTFSSAFGEGNLRIFVDSEDTVYYDISAIPDGMAEMFSTIESANDTYCVCSVALTAYNPFWRDAGTNTVVFGTLQGGFTLPFSFPFTLGRQGIGGAVNQGSVQSPAVITIEGAGQNPVITNTRTGEYISINYATSAGDTIQINTDPNITSVTYHAADGSTENIFGSVELGSSFFQLLPGMNEITVSDAAADNPRTVTIEWDNLYLGVF